MKTLKKFFVTCSLATLASIYLFSWLPIMAMEETASPCRSASAPAELPSSSLARTKAFIYGVCQKNLYMRARFEKIKQDEDNGPRPLICAYDSVWSSQLTYKDNKCSVDIGGARGAIPHLFAEIVVEQDLSDVLVDEFLKASKAMGGKKSKDKFFSTQLTPNIVGKVESTAISDSKKAFVFKYGLELTPSEYENIKTKGKEAVSNDCLPRSMRTKSMSPFMYLLPEPEYSESAESSDADKQPVQHV